MNRKEPTLDDEFAAFMLDTYPTVKKGCEVWGLMYDAFHVGAGVIAIGVQGEANAHNYIDEAIAWGAANAKRLWPVYVEKAKKARAKK